jgi:transcriptional regulator with XRE-family HTH domain
VYVVMDPERVRELREQKGMSKRDLAAAAGISLTTAKRVERGLSVRFPTGCRVLAVFEEEPPSSLGRPISRIPA